MYSDTNNHNFSNTLCTWLEKNNFSDDQIQYILDEWNQRDIFEILGEYFDVEMLYPDYYEFYDRRCIEFENKDIGCSGHRYELYKKWYEKSKKYYARKPYSIKVEGVTMTTKEYAKKYLKVDVNEELTQDQLDLLREDLKGNLWDYPIEEKKYCEENGINVVLVIDCNNEERLREV